MMRTHFLHIRKTGGSAIKHALEPVAAEYGIVLHPHSVTLFDIPAGERVFFFLRDPVSRFVSGFNYRKRCGMPQQYTAWRPGEERAFRRFPTAGDLARGLASTDAEVQAAAIAAMREIRHVNTRYVDWFVDAGCLMQRLNDIVFIGFQERLDDDFGHVKQILGLPDFLALPDDDRLANRAPPADVAELDDRAVESLRQWYAQDVALYDLCQNLRPRFAA